MRASAVCRCISTTRRRCLSPATAPTILEQCTSRWGIFSCKNWWRARSASTRSRARISWWTWAPILLASTATATSLSSSTSLRLKTPTSSSSSREGHHLSARGILAYCSQFSAHFCRYLIFNLQRCTYTALLFRSR